MESKDYDQSLVERIKNGDQLAFSEIMKKYQKRAYFFCLHMVSHPSEAEDLAQEAFVKVFKNIHKFRGDSSFQTWFYHILVNLCRSYLRHFYLVKRFTFCFPEKSESLDDGPQLSIETTIADQSGEGDPGKGIYCQELKRELTQAIASLPPQQKEIFTLKHFEGLKINEIAEVTGNATGTVKTHLFRAVQTLRVKLKDFQG